MNFGTGEWLGEIGSIAADCNSLAKSMYLWLGDITALCGAEIAIVNAANWSLKHGGGICGVIHRAAGPELEAACFSKCPDGLATTECILTPGFQLQVPYVIHAVTPMHGRARELEATYVNVLQLAARSKLQAVCIPALATGSHGFDQADAAQIAVRTAADFLAEIEELTVIFCAFTPEDLSCYKAAMIECLNVDTTTSQSTIPSSEPSRVSDTDLFARIAALNT